MPAQKRVKKTGPVSKVVGVVTSRAELKLAARMPSPPDLFEVRLDCLVAETGLERAVRALASPIIITARHPAEGGRKHISAAVRRDLLLRFLPLARYVDIELRSVRTSRALLDRARQLGVSTIISFHDLGSTPTLGSLRAKAEQARRLAPAVFKVATRTDTTAELSRLFQLISSAPKDLPICAMGIGRLGAVSRLAFAKCGSVFVYTSLHAAQVEGQLPLNRLRMILDQLEFAG
jgi:3-dehydroquinate dehydratase I